MNYTLFMVNMSCYHLVKDVINPGDFTGAFVLLCNFAPVVMFGVLLLLYVCLYLIIVIDVNDWRVPQIQVDFQKDNKLHN